MSFVAMMVLPTATTATVPPPVNRALTVQALTDQRLGGSVRLNESLSMESAVAFLPTVWQGCERPVCPPGGALLQVTGCGLCGSDVEKLARHTVRPGTVLGHEVVGRIAQLAPDYKGASLQVGDRVMVAHHVACQTCHYCQTGSPSMCRQFKATNLDPGGFSEWVALSPLHLQHTTFVIPDHIADREAACIEPLACVLRALDRVPQLADMTSAAVIGLGFIGLLAGQAFGRYGLKTLGLDINPRRLALAQVAGLVDCVHQPGSQASQQAQFLAEQTATGRVDVVCLTVCTASTIQQAMELVRDGGWIVLLAGPQATTGYQGLFDADALYHREVSVLPSYSPSLASLNRAKAWVFERKVRLTPLVTHPLPIDEFEEGLALYREGKAIKVFYHFPVADRQADEGLDSGAPMTW